MFALPRLCRHHVEPAAKLVGGASSSILRFGDMVSAGRAQSGPYSIENVGFQGELGVRPEAPDLAVCDKRASSDTQQLGLLCTREQS